MLGKSLTRREFMRLLAVFGFSATTVGTLSTLTGCGVEETPTSTSEPSTSTSTPTQSPTHDLAATSGATSEPTATFTPEPTPTSMPPYMAVVRGQSPTAIVQTALRALGGIERFVKPGDDVIIKPNLVAANHSYEYAAFTNPEVVAAITALCVGAGARKVRVMDLPTSGTCERVYAISGMADAVHAAGGEMEAMTQFKYRKVDIPEGQDITSWTVYGDVLDADVFIDVPIAKHHNLARLTLGMKNLMGIITDRNLFHSNLDQRIADLTSLVRPQLTIVDAVRILMDHGPTGGNLNDVKLANTVIASPDIVAADAYAATLFGLTGADIDALRYGAEMGLGTLDLNRIRIEEISV